ncbi:homoserine O-acetyltransferase [Spizellomyces punctatus DAOM BR117]|uniref:Homoserine O-acetyltransferase n=1 Tax=Spizellomyces punctatus (strain DAOM BR117) TaxID=645134 RepID=A0A0L0H614_SPIPD|nr:homoserine O-acetyltransferase [Spizellomyces punctatus DAOM BR117]KNC96148.1 homoserine O-acetyltransferase [Spizellomyces punctatus DAOM BR117]|eukprot:XP_016604188.1 homoserine O-acetyltransferase [Spizellomyces punctatus DAOM BR117]
MFKPTVPAWRIRSAISGIPSKNALILGERTILTRPTILLTATGRQEPSYFARHITSASTSRSSNPALSFPCLERNAERERSLDGGPEPAYDKIVSGYSTYHHSEPFKFVHGGVLPEFDIAYETWGTLNAAKDNAILLHTGLSASSHAKSHEKNTKDGWWEKFIGPGYPIDTNKFFVICTNALGGCYGSTGPSSIDPSNGERYATRFPIITIFDMIRAQFKLLDSLGIQKLHASVGSSMGGMQSLAAAALFPERVGRVVSISGAARSHPYSIALRHTQRQVLMADPNWREGFYYQGVPPHVGMKLARQIATISYRSGPEWEQRFGRKRANPDQTPALCPDFLIETYLDHQGERFCLQYDPNSLLYISKAMDMFDMSYPLPPDPNVHSPECHQQTQHKPVDCPISHPSPHQPLSSTTASPSDRAALVKGLSPITMPTLVLGVQSDILFPYWQQKEIADCLKEAGNRNVTYYELDAMYGHDTFLIDLVNIGGAVKGHLENVVTV